MRWHYFCDHTNCIQYGGHIRDTPISLYELINEEGRIGYKFGRIEVIE